MEIRTLIKIKCPVPSISNNVYILIIVDEYCRFPFAFPCSNMHICGGLSTFRSLRELPSGFLSTNTTQILQIRKQIEWDNNEH